MNEINYYTDKVEDILTGWVTIDEIDLFSELTINEDGISVRIIDFDMQLNRSVFYLNNSLPISFNHLNQGFYLLFGLNIIKSHSMKIGSDKSALVFSFSVQGFIYSQRYYIRHDETFPSISIYGNGVKQWSGPTIKVGNIIQKINNHLSPDDSDLIEFEKDIAGIGSVGLFNSFRYGGINGLHSFSLEVDPHIKFTFEQPVHFEDLIETYTDLYMILRFLIGESISISNVIISTSSATMSDGIQLYIPEKIISNKDYHNGMIMPYSSPYYEQTSNEFPESIWVNYFSPQNKDIKDLLKKYITYSMINSQEEQFLGYYRILETMTLEVSHFVDENDLAVLLNRCKPFLSKKFPCTSISSFIRAIKTANTKKNNTERCIKHFIKDLPQPIIKKFNLDMINIGEICDSRNKIIHQPLFIETRENIYNFRNNVSTLAKLAFLIRLGVPTNTIDNRIHHL
ncbi:hypothetical protein PUATCC27989T_05190 [Phytobacter ursingii]|nr:hypothetical protein PUATCC27989T_05190 [Phytobacter ursingii]